MDFSRNETLFGEYKDPLGPPLLKIGFNIFTTMFNTIIHHCFALLTMYVTEVICGKGLYLLRIIPVIFGLLLIKSLPYFLLPPLRDNYGSLVAFIRGARKPDLRNEVWEERVRKLEKSIESLKDQQKSYEANATGVIAKRPDTVTENTKELYAKYTDLARQFEVYRCRFDDWEKSHDSSYNALSIKIADIEANTSEIEKDLSTKIDENQSNSTKTEESLSNKIDDIEAYTSKIEEHLSTKIDKIPSGHSTVGKSPSWENLSKRIEKIQNHTSEIEEKLTRSREAEESLSKKINQIQSDNDKVKRISIRHHGSQVGSLPNTNSLRQGLQGP